MATSANAYALPNPAMVDPYPIESVLAKDSASPGALLALYRADRGIANEGYQHELDAQHDQMQRQLIATMANNAAERTVGAMAHPGGVAYMASQPAFSWMGLGGNQTGLQRYTGPDEQLQIGKAAVPGSEVAKNLAGTYYGLGQGETDFVTGLKTQPQVPVPVAGQQARAEGQRPPTFGTPLYVGTVNGQPIHLQVPMPIGASPEEERQRKRQAVQGAIKDYPGLRLTPGLDPGLTSPDAAPSPNTGAPQAPPDTTSAQTETPPPPLPPPASTDGSGSTTRYETPAESKAIISKPAVPGRTSLAPNPQAASAPAPEGNTTVGQLVVNGKLQQMAQQFVRSLPLDVRDDVLKEIMTSPNGGNAPLYPAKGGGFVLKGASGRFYPTPIQVTP